MYPDISRKELDMDLMDLKPTSNTVEVTLKHPNTGVVLKNEDKTDMTIVVYGYVYIYIVRPPSREGKRNSSTFSLQT